MKEPLTTCLNCGEPIYQDAVRRSSGCVHGELLAACEIAALRTKIAELLAQRNMLLAAARTAVENMHTWNEAVESVIGRQPKTGIELKPLIDAIAACEEVTT